MELIDHFGIRYNGNNPDASLKLWLKGMSCLMLLVAYILTYQLISVFATLLATFFPDTAALLKNRCSNAFWDLGLHLMKSNKVRFKVVGDKLSPYPAVVVSNHSSLVDCFVIHHLSRLSARINADSTKGDENHFHHFYQYYHHHLHRRSQPYQYINNTNNHNSNNHINNNHNSNKNENWNRNQSNEDHNSINDTNSNSQSLNLPTVNFFSWFLVWRVPTMKILLHLLKCDENWELEESSVLFVFARLLRSKFSEWIVMFPEVNIWTESSHNLQRQISEKYYLPALNNLLYPRFSAFYNVITALHKYKPHPYSNLYDLTIIYSHKTKNGEVSYTPPTLLEIFSSPSPITIIVYAKIRPISRIPQKRKKVERYLERLWKHKDKIISQIKTENSLHQAEKEPQDISALSLIANTSRGTPLGEQQQQQ